MDIGRRKLARRTNRKDESLSKIETKAKTTTILMVSNSMGATSRPKLVVGKTEDEWDVEQLIVRKTKTKDK